MVGKSLIVGFVLAVFIAGCGASGGFIRDSSTSNIIQYRMPVEKITHLKTVYGEANTGSVFCFIPVNPDPYSRAVEDLYANAKLGPNQAVIDLVEDRTTRNFLGFYCNTSVRVSGRVIEVVPAKQPAKENL